MLDRSCILVSSLLIGVLGRPGCMGVRAERGFQCNSEKIHAVLGIRVLEVGVNCSLAGSHSLGNITG